MDTGLQLIAARCVDGAARGTMDFPTIVGTLMAAGFDGYQVDLRAGTATYYLPGGEVVTLQAERVGVSPTVGFEVDAVVAAIRDAQQHAPGYTYAGFCARVGAAGCVGYHVSFPGRRVVYMGRTGEQHTEHFPPAPPQR